MMDSLFSKYAYFETVGRKAKLITSLSMLYDLEDPVAFAREVADCLTDDGIWHLELCYLPLMLAANSYDTICHEHLTYFTLQTVRAILEQVGMHMVDVEFNDVNGGSFAVTAKKDRPSQHVWHTTPDGVRHPGPANVDTQNRRTDEETSLQHLSAFHARALHHRDALRSLLDGLHTQGKRVGGLGASTKGNTLLQYVGLGMGWLEGIGEVNPQKIGRYAATGIPIVSEEAMRECEYLLVLPWHLRRSIIEREQAFLDGGGHLIFPLPEIEVV
jgi:hypothetical protein